jgi:hypothetical protein
LGKEAFVGTGTVSAVIVDVSRLLVYGAAFSAAGILETDRIGGLVAAATFAAFLGAFLGTRLLKKITLKFVQILVGILLMMVGIGMAAGLL